MKTFPVTRFLSIALCLSLSALFTGCCSYTVIDRNIPDGAIVEGEKPEAVILVQNTSYQILGCIPWCTGVSWTEDEIPFDDANSVRMEFFCDKVTLDNNILSVKRVCKEVGSNRIASLTNIVNEDNIWSIFLVNRKTLKTTCFILPKNSGKANQGQKVTK